MSKILIVDDEQAQRETLSRGLFLLGHQCVSAGSAGEAMELLGEEGSRPFELLLTDLTMPGESGLQLIERVRKLKPDLRVLVISGLHSGQLCKRVRAWGIPVLQKPFNLEQLEAAIK